MDSETRRIERSFLNEPTFAVYEELVRRYERAGLDFKHLVRQRVADALADIIQPYQLAAGGLTTLIGNSQVKEYKERLSRIDLTLCEISGFEYVAAGSNYVHSDDWRIIAQMPDRFILATHGYWNTIHRCQAMAVDRRNYVYGLRTLSSVREDGYNLRGVVSLKGVRYPSFTGEALLSRPADGVLISKAVLWVSSPAPSNKCYHR